jgi:hypothetical protein
LYGVLAIYSSHNSTDRSKILEHIFTMATHVDSDQYTKPFLLTQTGHRDPYPAISPEKPGNSQAGKIIIITGGGSGIGAVRVPLSKPSASKF